MLDLRVDGAAIDRTSALLALHYPGAREPQIQTGHTRNDRRIKGESHPFSRRTAIHPLFYRPRSPVRFRASDKLAAHARQIPPYGEGALYSRPLRTWCRSTLDTKLEHRSHAADCDHPPAPISAQAHLWPYALGSHSLLGKGTVYRSEDD